MFIQFGIIMLFVWLCNYLWMLYTFLKNTPNWKDESMSSDDLIHNWLTNAPLEQIEFMGNLNKSNSFLGYGGVILILIGIILL